MKGLSGKFVLRIAPELHGRLKDEADQLGESLNQCIVRKLSENLSTIRHELVGPLQREFGKNLIGVLLFGSQVTGRATEKSDCDVLIVLSEDIPVERELYRRWDKNIAPLVDETYSPQFVHLPNLERVSSLWLEISLENQILFDLNQKVNGTLRQIRQAISVGHYRRGFSHGHPYWVYNEGASSEK